MLCNRHPFNLFKFISWNYVVSPLCLLYLLCSDVLKFLFYLKHSDILLLLLLRPATSPSYPPMSHLPPLTLLPPPPPPTSHQSITTISVSLVLHFTHLHSLSHYLSGFCLFTSSLCQTIYLHPSITCQFMACPYLFQLFSTPLQKIWNRLLQNVVFSL